MQVSLKDTAGQDEPETGLFRAPWQGVPRGVRSLETSEGGCGWGCSGCSGAELQMGLRRLRGESGRIRRATVLCAFCHQQQRKAKQWHRPGQEELSSPVSGHLIAGHVAVSRQSWDVALPHQTGPSACSPQGLCSEERLPRLHAWLWCPTRGPGVRSGSPRWVLASHLESWQLFPQVLKCQPWPCRWPQGEKTWTGQAQVPPWRVRCPGRWPAYLSVPLHVRSPVWSSF